MTAKIGQRRKDNWDGIVGTGHLRLDSKYWKAGQDSHGSTAWTGQRRQNRERQQGQQT
jgi:hypothetical protein